MILSGIAASEGVGIGRAVCVRKQQLTYQHVQYAGAEQEGTRLAAAIAQFCSQTQQLCDEVRQRIGQKESEILSGQILMLQDPELQDELHACIQGGSCAEAAVDKVCRAFAEIFAAIDDEMMQQRAADVQDIRARMLALLLGVANTDLTRLPQNSILVAEELTPSMTVGLQPEHVSAILTQTGGYTSHSAILARSMGLPAVVSIPKLMELVQEGEELVANGTTGDVILSPTEQELSAAKQALAACCEKKRQLAVYQNRQTVDADGNCYALYANIGAVADAAAAAKSGAEGIGLFRTEFLFMDRSHAPSEETQYQAYRTVADCMKGKEVIIRTLDVGGDKEIAYLGIAREDNPFLGYRAIRYCLEHPDLYKKQLRALLRAGAESKNVKIMLPMITSVEQVRSVRLLLEECKKELRQEALAFDDAIRLGIMIETPSAVLLAEELAAECDFFSIGTNDLTQYILAVDRGNPAVAGLYQTLHPSVLRAIQHTIAAAKKAGIPVGMCGEAAADQRLLPVLMAWGLDEFSVSAPVIVSTRAAMERWHLTDARALADRVLKLSTAAEMADTLNR